MRRNSRLTAIAGFAVAVVLLAAESLAQPNLTDTIS
jgi:hypothetical protein